MASVMYNTTVLTDVHDAWVDSLMPKLSGAILENVKQVVDETIIELLSRSGVWRANIGPFSVIKNKQEVFIEPVYSQLVVGSVKRVWFNTTEIFPIADATSLTSITTATPLQYSVHSNDVLMLTPSPEATASKIVTVGATLLPKRGTYIVPKFVFDKYFEGVISGALAKLYREPNRPYTDINLSTINERKFRGAVGTARASAETGFALAQPNWSFPKFA